MSHIRTFVSPETAYLELLDTPADKAGNITLIFDRVPFLKRRKLWKLCETNFPVETGRWPKMIIFDRLVLAPRRTCTGVRLVLK